ncbi:MAG: RdgB/HAM1 family non-canonical purine NTP pyrophosphatase [Bacteroidales bacterium]|nr:RdgB/HAM1 family non-canonical purine NTP pyrophosphatase [Bacteroidales bacterium]
MKLVFATANPGKVREAAEILGPGFQIITAAEAGISEDIPETGNSLRANSLQKAQYIYERTGLDCFADDSGLEVDILGGEPGVHTARYGGVAHDADRNMSKLLWEMGRREREASVMREMGISTPRATRKARFRTSVTLIIGGEKHFFDGVMEGSIARERRGDGGFGYDPVFIPEGMSQTNGELGEAFKNTISHRGKALRAMAAFLHEREH